ncbi:hypothetical protein HYT53_03865 [Candidatus Woesearchaeota archaeon]|nr:hypothetical protein [Candidatus Woesearchaeota archaeon]
MTDYNKKWLLMLLAILIIVSIGLYYLGPTITGFVTKEFSYTEDLNLVVTSSGNYTWQLGNIGDLKSASIDGSITNYGKARVYLESNGIRHLIFDSAMLNETKAAANGSNLITGFVVDGEKKDKNKKPKWVGANEFIINGTTQINLSQQFIDDDNDAMVYSASDADGIAAAIVDEIATLTPILGTEFNTTIIFTASDGVDSKSQVVNLIVIAEQTGVAANITLPLNETPAINQTNETINITIPINETINQTLNITPTINETITNITNQTNITAKTIAINLAYKSGTVYDANDNGEESVNGVVDLTAEDSLFSWDADKSRLCTRWEIYSFEDDKLTTLCNGNNDCCAFVSLLPTSSNWNDVYYSTFGKDGAAHNNIVSAQVLYYDVNTSIDNPKSEIYYSEWGNLSAKFFEEETLFSGICLETCALTGLNKSSYSLVFEIEDNAILRIDRIKYSVISDVVNQPPVLLQNFSGVNILVNGNATINLSKYFSDPDGDILAYSYFKADNITILFENETATIVPDRNVNGARFTYIIANDSESFAVSNIFMINISGEIKPTDVNFFEIRDTSNNKLAVFDSLGNVKIKGVLIPNIEPFADENDFIVQNSTNGLNLAITNPEGNMMIKGSLLENQELLAPTPNSFIIQDKDEQVVAYVNSTGSLFLKGALGQNAVFEQELISP